VLVVVGIDEESSAVVPDELSPLEARLDGEESSLDTTLVESDDEAQPLDIVNIMVMPSMNKNDFFMIEL